MLFRSALYRDKAAAVEAGQRAGSVTEEIDADFDFGIGKGGDIFDLAGEFIGSKDFLLRAAFIARNGAYPLPIIKHSQRNEEKEPVFNDIWVRPLQDTRLLGYLEERGINAHVAIPNCEEVKYRVRGKRYYAIGAVDRKSVV